MGYGPHPDSRRTRQPSRMHSKARLRRLQRGHRLLPAYLIVLVAGECISKTTRGCTSHRQRILGKLGRVANARDAGYGAQRKSLAYIATSGRKMAPDVMPM